MSTFNHVHPTSQVGIKCICMSTSIQTTALIFQITDFMEPAESKVLTLVRLKEEQQQGHLLADIFVPPWKYYQYWEYCQQLSQCSYNSWSDLIQLFISQTQFVLMGLPGKHTKFCQTKERKGPVVHMTAAERGECYMTPVGIIWVKQQSLRELSLTKTESKEAIDHFQIIHNVFCLAE